MQNELDSWKKTLSALTDDVLVAQTRSCARGERAQTAWLVAHLAEVFRRDLALKRGHRSLTEYARAELGLSDRQAWERVCAARLSLQLPETPGKLVSGELTLCKIVDLWRTLEAAEQRKAPPQVRIQAPLLPVPMTVAAPARPTVQEKRELLGQILGKSRRESETVLQSWKCQRTGAPETARARPHATRRPQGPWTELGFYLSDGELGAWDRLRDLLSQKLGTRDPRAVLEWLVELGLDRVDPVRQEARHRTRQEARRQKKRRDLATTTPGAQPQAAVSDAPFLRITGAARKERRRIPAALRRRIWIRDGGCCQFACQKTGRKCASTAFLDIDHRIPLGEGGTDEESNLTLACASHNRRRPFWKPDDQPLYAALLGAPGQAADVLRSSSEP